MSSTVRIVIQARTSSSRLPGKSLLSIAGYPMAVLCALRAGNCGATVLLATSDTPSDDVLAATAEVAGIAVFRGPIDNVLGRFVMATQDMSDDDLVVRLTADNMFPDGDLVQELVSAMRSTDLQYLAAEFPESGLPYGLSAECMTVSALREADRTATAAPDREHVTPLIRRIHRKYAFRPREVEVGDEQSRCTIDSLDDFLRISRVINSVNDPTRVPWRELQRLLLEPASPTVSSRTRKGEWLSELSLGTAQLGLDNYGIVEPHRRLERAGAVGFVHEAMGLGINRFDSARAYGLSESVLGEALRFVDSAQFRVVTKLDPLLDVPATASHVEVRNAVDASVLRSCRELRTSSLDTVMLHRWAHRHAWQCAAWNRLLELREEGVVKSLGASVYTPEEAQAALDEPEIRRLQIPFNILDYRWRQSGVPSAARGRSDVLVYVRSALLQGVLAASPPSWPVLTTTRAAEWVDKLEAVRAATARENRVDLCLAYVRAQDWIDSIVLGFQKVDELRQAASYFARPCLDEMQVQAADELLAGAPGDLLDPRTWSNSAKAVAT